MTSTESFFDALKSHRKSKDIEISEISEFTKINAKYIEAIESGDFSILPTVYMRLFIRAYANFIGADSTKTLEDFELHTTGTINKRTDFILKSTGDTSNLGEVKETMESINQISPKQIATGTAVLIGLFLILYWAGEITSQQSNEVDKNYVPLEETAPNTPPIQETKPSPVDNANSVDNSAKKKIQ